jgi:hypothetical protein
MVFIITIQLLANIGVRMAVIQATYPAKTGLKLASKTSTLKETWSGSATKTALIILAMGYIGSGIPCGANLSSKYELRTPFDGSRWLLETSESGLSLYKHHLDGFQTKAVLMFALKWLRNIDRLERMKHWTHGLELRHIWRRTRSVLLFSL